MFTGLLQPTHLIILLAVALILLGPKRLPDAGRALGQGLREFKDSMAHEPQQPLPEAVAAEPGEPPPPPCPPRGGGANHESHAPQTDHPGASPPPPPARGGPALALNH